MMKQPPQRFVLPRVHEGEGLAKHMEHYSKEPVTLIEHIFPGDTNDHDTLFGGRLLSIMDKAGGIACSKFAHREFVTISIDTLKFIAPARQGDLLEVTGKVVFTSTHTACTKVTAMAVDKATWKKKKICEGYFFFVAIDSMMRPIPIPQLEAQTDDEKADWAHAERIREQMRSNKTD